MSMNIFNLLHFLSSVSSYFAIVFLFFLFHYFGTTQVRSYLEENGIEVRDYGAVSSDVVLLASDQLSQVKKPQEDRMENMETNCSEIDEESSKSEKGEKNCNLIWVDPGSCCFALFSKLNADQVLLQQSPLALAKAIKVVYSHSLLI